ncbi:MAG: accessory factor UbiK family protein [Quisquiliibacterium sp.]
MDKQSVLNKLQDRLTDLMRNSPAQDLERNMKALLGQAFSKFELVTREEFDAQIELLTSLRARVDRLEKLIAALESPTADNPPGKHPGEPS